MKTLTDIIYQYKNSKLLWGQFDCCIFSIKVIEEYTGKTYPLWRDVIDYTDFKGAMKALRKLNCNNIEDLPELILGNPKKDISKVKLGEPVYYINERGESIFGICNGVQSYFLQMGGGLTTRKTEDCIYCWGIE
jgi:hypothetical protein